MQLDTRNSAKKNARGMDLYLLMASAT